MSVDDPSDDRQQSRVGADDHEQSGVGADDHEQSRPSTDDRRPTPTALRADDTSLTIEFGRETGEIRIQRETALGTYTESVDR